jgi:hypothetical protein
VLTRFLLALSLLSSTHAGAAEEPAAPVLLDEVVAVIDLRVTHVLLLSDVQSEARLARARQFGAEALRGPLEGSALSDALDALIDQRVVLDEAAKLQLAEPSPAEIAAGVAALQVAVGPAAFKGFATQYDLDESDVQDIVRRQLRVAQYLEGRFRLASRPREADVTAYVAAHPELRGRDPASVALEVREKLGRMRFVQLSSAFIADVRRRGRIRILHDPSTPPGATPLSGTSTAADTPVRLRGG